MLSKHTIRDIIQVELMKLAHTLSDRLGLPDPHKPFDKPVKENQTMTKSELCNIIVNTHFDGRPIDETEILQHSTLAVAMEYLGLLSKRCYVDYANERYGILFFGNIQPSDKTPESRTLYFRNLLNLLPD